MQEICGNFVAENIAEGCRMAEIIPYEPDADNADVGKMKRPLYLLCSLLPLYAAASNVCTVVKASVYDIADAPPRSVLTADAVISTDDSLSVALDEVLIETNSVSRSVPMAITTLDSRDLRRSDSGQDLPWMLQMTPSLVVGSDNGLGIGLSSFRIRGTDGSRINLTLDGVALNDAEDQTVFWANMNAFVSSLGSLQIQRGVGTSTVGSGAFGATVTMQSQKPAMEPYVTLFFRTGSYATNQYTVSASSGLLRDHWVAEARYSQTLTDGYIDRTAANLGSHFATVSYFADDWVLQLKNFGSFEHTGQAWNGVPSDSIAAGNRTYNSLGKHLTADGRVAFTSTTDNYTQNHTQLSLLATPTASLSLHGVLHYTYGTGYYDDYKSDAHYSLYNLAPYTNDFGQMVSRGDVVRQKWLRNHTGTALFDLRYRTDRLLLTTGTTISFFDGLHWGQVVRAPHYPLHIGGHYYDSDAFKTDASAFAKAEYSLTQHLQAYADLQYRHVTYRIGGLNDKFLSTGIQQVLDIHERFPFFNPKGGISFRTGHHHAYASYARTHREPTRNNYTDAGTTDPLPRAETLDDFEAGYHYRTDPSTPLTIQAGINFYHMHYTDQLILTGRLSDIGEALATNVPHSYRRGMEITSSLGRGIVRWDANCTLSQNRILDFTEYVDNWDGDPIPVHYDHTNIAFSPALTAASNLFIGTDKLWGSLCTRYVSRQYLDNTSSSERSINPYCVTDLQMGYAFRWQHYFEQASDFQLTLSVNNLFGAHYATGGWVYSAVSPSNDYTLENRYYEDGLFVQAPTTIFLSLAIKI